MAVFSSRLRIFFCVGALASLFGVAPAVAQSAPGPAVSGPNGKISVEGGEYDDEGSFLAKGSYSLPIGQAFGLQFDGAVGRIDDETMGGGGLHLFTRKPDQYLFGLYGSYHTWNDIDIWRIAGEFELYLDRFSFTGLAGLEGVEFPSADQGLQVLNNNDEHVFAHVDAAYYLTDDFRVSGGYRYISEAHLAAVGAEYLLRSTSLPISLFVDSHFGEQEFTRITGGVKVYLGADKHKSLIDRHRQDDPPNYTPVFPDIRTAGTAGPPAVCPINVPLNVADPCVCPDGSDLSIDEVKVCVVVD